jgi:hypothetical protein
MFSATAQKPLRIKLELFVDFRIFFVKFKEPFYKPRVSLIKDLVLSNVNCGRGCNAKTIYEKIRLSHLSLVFASQPFLVNKY